MSIHDEPDLRERLGGVLDTITPSPAPVSATVRQGEAIKMRRWIYAAAGLAVVAILAAVGPGVLHRALAPAGPASYRVTVHPPGPGSGAGLIASGTINARHWKVVAATPGGGSQCIGFGGGESCASRGPVPSARKDPAEFGTSGEGTVLYEYGVVRRDVSRVDVILGNGTVLTLHPVSMYNRRYVAFAVPSRLAVTEVVAYSGASELAFSIPFRSEVVSWLRPGAPLHPRSKVRVGSGVVNGAAWSEYAYVGPWGRCFGGAGSASTCYGGYGPLLSRGEVTGEMIISGGGSGQASQWYHLAAAAPSVDYVRFALSDGSGIKVQTHDVLGQRFYTFAVAARLRVLSWTAYGAHGVRVGTGRGGFGS
jgi:hypothetical protein